MKCREKEQSENIACSSKVIAYPLPRENISYVHKGPVFGQRCSPVANVNVVSGNVDAVLECQEFLEVGNSDKSRTLQVSSTGDRSAVDLLGFLCIGWLGIAIVRREKHQRIVPNRQVLEAQTDCIFGCKDQSSAHVLATLLRCR